MIESFVVPSFLGNLAPTFAPLGNHLPQVFDTGGVCGSPEAHTDDGNWHRLVLLKNFESILSLNMAGPGGLSGAIGVKEGSHFEPGSGDLLSSNAR